MGSSDMQVIFPVFLFVLILSILSSFFVVTNGELGLSSSNEINFPYTPEVVGEEYKYENGSIVPEGGGGGDLGTAIFGIGMIIIGGIITVLTLGSGAPIAAPLIGVGGLTLLGAGTITTITGITGSQFVHSIPVVGSFFDAIAYAATAMVSFFGLTAFTLEAFAGWPIVLMAICVPISFIFFVFIIRFIRGQG
jgi:hypothetical protein